MTDRMQLTAEEVIAGHDLTGFETVVTGGYSGIGLETSRALAAAGARVVIAGRDAEKGASAATELIEATGNDKIVSRPLDLTSLASIAAWTTGHVATGKPLHILVNNAGVMAPPLSRTADGFELQMGVNHLGHFAFTVGLLPCLREAGRARVISVSSSAHRRADIDFDDPHYLRRPYEAFAAYGQSKTANALFAVAFSARYADEGLTANAVMPGAIRTPLQRHMTQAMLQDRGWIDGAGRSVDAGWKSPTQGAATSIWAAVAPELDDVAGEYLEDCAIAEPWTQVGPMPRGHYLPRALDADRAESLWQLSRYAIGCSA